MYASRGKVFPEDPLQQLRSAIYAVFDSWQSDRAKVYIAVNQITGLKVLPDWLMCCLCCETEEQPTPAAALIIVRHKGGRQPTSSAVLSPASLCNVLLHLGAIFSRLVCFLTQHRARIHNTGLPENWALNSINLSHVYVCVARS